jgi:aryl-alcohol dehydrogenase-like predicted oxidoreductase
MQALQPIAVKHGTGIADVAARWVIQRPLVPAIILGARNASHVEDHQRLFTFELDGGDLGAIQEVLEQRPGRPQGDCYAWERGGKW